jgi:16S rRNA (guanine527-N7)-methyltransferase
MADLYRFWNTRINIISRKDIENLEIHHFLHSLSIAKYFHFKPGTRILDAGTGGGFPGMPLAILFPETEFTLADSITKKIRVVETIKTELGLNNVNPLNDRFENIPGQFDFIVGRAISSLPELWSSLDVKILDQCRNDRPNGILYLKGGEFSDELSLLRAQFKIYYLSDYFTELFFETKKLIHIYNQY